MFKSVFAKYVTALMVIITLGFALLLVIVTSIVSKYSYQAKLELMDNAAQVTKTLLEQSISDEHSSEFDRLAHDYENTHLNDILNIFADGSEEMTIVLANREGKILSAVGKNVDAGGVVGQVLPIEISQSLLGGDPFGEIVSIDFLPNRVLVYAVGIFDEQGAFCGIAALYSTNFQWSNMVEQLTDTVLTSALLVLLAALIAAYFISERIIGPLREMSIAAKRFAAGKFDTRVRVKGHDEVAALAGAFNDMASSLENLESMRSSFIANVSHDLRTPMTTISGFIDGIRDGVIPKEEHEHYLEVISIEVRRLSRLVSSLLDLSRIQAGDRKFVMKPFDVCEMGRVILISFEKQIEEKNLDVEFECENDRMITMADHDAIYQIFYNICHNAVKFASPNGKLRIRIVNAKDKKVQVSVYNDGQGIPKEDIPLVFERFYKSDKSRSLDKTGIGLGLYISKTIISAHGEKIWVNSEFGKNCEFFFTLSRANHNHLHSNDLHFE